MSEPDFDTLKAFLLEGGGVLLRAGFADCPFPGVHFDEAEKVPGNHIVYLYFGDAAVTPFHSEAEVRDCALEALRFGHSEMTSQAVFGGRVSVLHVKYSKRNY